MTRAPFSVLMATYARERPEHLHSAIGSLFCQSLLPEDLVIVFDGPVGTANEAVVDQASSSAPFPVHIVRLDENRGLASALNAGLPFCRAEYVARMDSDDVCARTRFERQALALASEPAIDVLGSWHAEFESDVNRVERLKSAPADHEAIVRHLKWRNVLSHPTIVVRRSTLEAVGGYRNVPLLEDWDLYLRLARHGARFGVVEEPLVKVRVTDHAQRRGGFRYVAGELRFRRDCLRRGDIDRVEFFTLAVGYSCWRLVPTPARKALYPLARVARGSA